MNNPNLMARTFRGWKLWLAIFLGLSVAGWMLWSSLSEVHFMKVPTNQGTHIWVDDNNDNQINLDDVNEFKPVSSGGDFILKSQGDIFHEIQLNSVGLFWIFMALIFVVGRDFFYMLRIRLLTKKALSWRQSFSVIMIWEFASALAPGVISGSAVAMFILNREKIALGKSTAIVFITALMDNLFYILLIPLVFLVIDNQQLFPNESFGSRSVEVLFWTGYFVFLSIVIALVMALFLFPSFFNILFKKIANIRFLFRWKEGLIKTGNDIEISSRVLRKESVFFWLKVFLFTCGSWISRFLVINALLQAFLRPEWIQHALILGKQLVLWLLMRVSPTPGGSGVAEYAFGELLADIGGSALLMSVLALLWRLISYFPYLFMGAYILPRWIKRTELSVNASN